MSALLRRATAITALSWLMVGSAHAADWELWPQPTTWPPEEQMEYLSVFPGWVVSFMAETDSSWLVIDVLQTREKDGKLYKAIQLIQDTDLAVTAPVGKWLTCGATIWMYPVGSGVDILGQMKAFRLISIEVDGTVIPIDMETYLQPKAIDLSWFGLEGMAEGAGYNVPAKFNTTGTHTLKAIFRQVEEFFYTDNYEIQGLVDPSPEFQLRRVLVKEQVGNPVDGDMVYNYTLTVVEQPTAIEATTWARIKAAMQE